MAATALVPAAGAADTAAPKLKVEGAYPYLDHSPDDRRAPHPRGPLRSICANARPPRSRPHERLPLDALAAQRRERKRNTQPQSASRRGRRRSYGSGSSGLSSALTMLTMIAASTPHQNVSISKSGTTQSVT